MAICYSNPVGFDYRFAKIPPKMHLESTVAQIRRQFWGEFWGDFN